MTCPYGRDSQGGTSGFSVTWETVLNNVIQAGFLSLSYIALYSLNQETLQLQQ